MSNVASHGENSMLVNTTPAPAVDNPVGVAVVRLDGSARLTRELIGNKGFGLDSMRGHGLPVPPAFAITTAACRAWQREPRALMERIWSEVAASLAWLEAETDRTFGGAHRPLLVSVRSAAAHSMPGMMDTVLDLGIDDGVEGALAQEGGAAFATDTRARFEHMYRRIVLRDDNHTVPADPHRQLRGAIEAVFASWNSARARTYRTHHGLEDEAGTAVIVQAMVFGNLDETSGTGVLFTRDPMTGAVEPFGEWLSGGQGEDVVSGTTNCLPLSALRDAIPQAHHALLEAGRRLERLAADVQDIEFTIESGTLWLLQTRTAKRSAAAAVRIVLALRSEGVIDDAEVLRRVTPAQLATLLQPTLQHETRMAAPLLASGLPACPGIARGRVVTDPDEAVDAADNGEQVILVRTATSPDDVHGMLAAQGIVTAFGGATSHAAVVSREIGRPAVVGCGPDTLAALAGRVVTVDGEHGEVREGALELTAWSETDNPDLRALTDIAARATALRVVQPGTPGVPHLTDISEETVAAALASGAPVLASPSPLRTLLIAARLSHAEQRADGESGRTTREHRMSELDLLQAVRLKGRARPADLAATAGVPEADGLAELTRLGEAGLIEIRALVRITPAGRDRLSELLAAERAAADGAAVTVPYSAFRAVNADFKALVVDWQLRDGEPNPHTDADYDAAVIARLAELHERVRPILASAAEQIPRLGRYAGKLSDALTKVRAGERSWFTKPIADSYHTVWFELHEELILVAGMTREAEAEAGHAH